METALALSVLLTVALASAPGSPRRAAPSPPAAPQTRLGVWNEHAVPVIISLVDDLRAVESDTANPILADPRRLSADDGQLRTDIGAAQRLLPAPDHAVGTAWSGVVGRLLLADRTLHAAATSLDPAAIALAHQEFAAAGDDLLGVGEAISSGG